MNNQEAERQAKIEELKKYISDFDNLSECGFFSSSLIDDHVFYYKGLTLFQFLHVGREFIREFELQPEPKPVNKTDEELASKTEYLLSTLNKIYNLSDDKGVEGCTYGDTEYDSESVVYGYNSALSYCRELAYYAIEKFKNRNK